MSPLKPQQEQAAIMLVSGKTGRATAKELGVTPETISKWRQSAEFEALTNELRGDALEAARETLRAGVKEAADGIISLATGAKNEGVRLKACVHIVELVGYHNLQSGRHGRDITETDPEKIRVKRMSEKQWEAVDDKMSAMVLAVS